MKQNYAGIEDVRLREPVQIDGRDKKKTEQARKQATSEIFRMGGF
jgi:hypothetical protein